MYQPPTPLDPMRGWRGVGVQAPDRPRWMRRAAPACVALPWMWLAVFWIGFLATADSWAGLTWLSVMWMICVAVLPAGVLGSVWAGMLRERGMMWGGIVGSVLLIPGFGFGFVFLMQLLHTLVTR